MTKSRPPPLTRGQFKPPSDGNSSTLRLDLLELWVNSSQFDPEKIIDDYRVTVGGRALSKVRVGGVGDPELRIREFGLQFLEVASTDEPWFEPFHAWKGGLNFKAFDTGGFAVITDDWIDLMMVPAAFRGFLAAVQAKDISEVSLALSTDLWELYSHEDGPLFIPDLEDRKFGRAYISQLSFKSKPLALVDPDKHAAADEIRGLDDLASQMKEAIRLLYWIATVVTGVAAARVFRR